MVRATGTMRNKVSAANGICLAIPIEILTKYEEIDKLAPMRIGPSVTPAQYIMMRWAMGRGRVTRQIELKARSIVSISVKAVTPKNKVPKAVSRPARALNCST